MAAQNSLIAIGNLFMKLILHSPLHGLMSGNTLLVTVTGRKTGRRYTTPTNYLREGDRLTITSLKSRTWWRNLRGGAPVTVCLQGREAPGRGSVIEDPPQVASALAAYLGKAPQYARYFNVALDAGGKPSANDVAREAQTRVVVQVRLN
jgi:deazaflavin-dependent oxidoreductase (nitroreductase family)